MELRTAILPELVRIPGGCFLMGDDEGRPDERPRHEVELPDFFAARLPVTNAEYARFIGATGRETPRFWQDPAFNSPLQPVIAVTWGDSCAYCAWLSTEAGQRYRLPTEAEWERAARGGLEGAAYPWGAEPPLVGGLSLARVSQTAPYPTGTAPANGFGLIDVGFNIHEWCLDWYNPGYYARSPRSDPRGPATGTRRASRGGAWRHQIKVCRCAARSSLDPIFRYNDYGFRVFSSRRDAG
ncbi:MAG: formylglycine-generating enzyme family protein [Dehalococcoidia bacterium]